jgi:sugar lactone lactonase YvrE
MRIRFRTLVFCLLAGWWVAAAQADSWTVKNFAGTGVPGYSGDGGPALQARLNHPFGVVRGPDGGIYFCEMEGNVVRKVDHRGIITTVAGTGHKGPGGDGGPALQAEFNMPHEVRFDKAGDLYISDMSNFRIRKVDMKTGIITSVAGTGARGFSGDGGPAVEAALNEATGIQFDARGDLYICDVANNRLRKVDMKTGIISTIAGTGQTGSTPDGVAFKDVPLHGPRAVDFDRAGNLWLALRDGNQVFKLNLAAGTIHLVAGSGKAGYGGDGGLAKAAVFKAPKGMAVSPKYSRVILADTENHRVRLIDTRTGKAELLCGTGEKGDGPYGPGAQCRLSDPHGVFEDADGSIFVSNSGADRIVVLRPSR